MSSPPVLCVGVLVSDLFVPPVDRLPTPGELLLTDDFLIEPGGCAANVAVALSRLGVAAGVIGRVGDDLYGEQVKRDLSALGIDTSGVVTTPELGTSKTVIVSVVGEDRRYLHTFGANAALEASDIGASAFETADVIYVGGYLILPALRNEELAPRLAAARARGAKTILDVAVPAGQNLSVDAVSRLLPHVDYFVPNLDEAFALTGEPDPRRQADRLIEHGALTVLIKLGDQGIHVRSAAESFELDAPPIDVVEPSGAGDAFAAGLAVGILEGWDLTTMVRFASVIGASACTALGCAAGILSRREADAFIAEHPLALRGVGTG